MIITQSQMQLQSSHTLLEYQRRDESLTTWRTDANGQRQQTTQATRSERLHMEASSSLLIQNQSRMPALQPAQTPQIQAAEAAARGAPAGQPVQETDQAADATVGGFDDLQLTFIKLLIERLTGRKLELFDASQLSGDPSGSATVANGGARAVQGSVYSFEEITLEQESTQFSAQGIVHTADGQEIQIDLQLNMSREFLSQTSLSVRSGDALKDPLVINFDGNAAELAATKFAFDIDADGTLDQMAFVAPGSGFLALDHNSDGVINDGSELFGALSGNGFADLRQYDDDGNGWIDENDAIFAKLLIWTRSADGTDRLAGLLEHNVGAIYLGHTDTPFALKDEANALQGLIRASGVFLKEDGGVGSVQQLDLVV